MHETQRIVVFVHSSVESDPRTFEGGHELAFDQLGLKVHHILKPNGAKSQKMAISGTLLQCAKRVKKYHKVAFHFIFGHLKVLLHSFC